MKAILYSAGSWSLYLKKIFLNILLLCILGFSLPGFSDDRIAEANGFTVYLTILPIASYTKPALLTYDYHKPQQLGKKVYLSQVFRGQVNCKKKIWTIESISYYEDHKADGDNVHVIMPALEGLSDRLPIEGPGTIGLIAFQRACGEEVSQDNSHPSITDTKPGISIEKSPIINGQTGWRSDWGSGIIAFVLTDKCEDSELISLGLTKRVISTIPMSRLKNRSDAWSVFKDRAVTIDGCWRTEDGTNLITKLKRKRDGKMIDQDINLDDGSWSALN